MNFEIKRKGYDKGQVDAYIKKLEEAAAAKDERVASLESDIAALKSRLNEVENKRSLIVKSIYSAIAKADQIEKLAKSKYDAEMARLKAFHEKWTAYYNKLLAKYPLDDELMAFASFNRDMDKALSPSEQHEAEKSRLSGKGDFDPEERIRSLLSSDEQAATRPVATSKEYRTGIARVNPALSGTSDSGFSFDEALNPTEDLSEIMKDLGLMEE